MTAAIRVSAAILVRDGLILACQRGANQSHAGKWEFPGGKQEPGESIETCMRRELHEELGIAATVGRELWRTTHAYPGNPTVELVFFRIDAFAGEPTNRVFADMRWVAPDRLAELDFLAADRELIARLPKLLADASSKGNQ
jgi:8-oxo-dGTP diphosphatase